MNVSINGRLFEWDDAKNKINKIKHGINFKTAVRVFEDPYRIMEYDYEHSFDEDRWKVIGMIDDVLTVIYTDRENSTRIISAYEANEHDRREYYGHRILLLTGSAATLDGGGES
ncbi:MAG: BrnT family toxin [Selenomonadaceae bacterium]|nr:BrnT family toxin [Selenomonadaceae bacterium]MBR4384281.1 BrnT family toxin [Selenomonadaceae bacterium]